MKRFSLLNRPVLALILTLSSLLGASISGAQEYREPVGQSSESLAILRDEAWTRLSGLLGGKFPKFADIDYIGIRGGYAVFQGQNNRGVQQVGCRFVRSVYRFDRSEDNAPGDFVARCYPFSPSEAATASDEHNSSRF